MIFNGLQKMTLLDFPGKVAATLFIGGCNFRCPFCHNAGLVIRDEREEFDDSEVLSYLSKRKGLIDGVCITGGEPLLCPELKDFIIKVKAMGLAVKLDTNGSFPEKLKDLVENGLLDYVAMDIKSSVENYSKAVGIENFNTEKIEQSIDFLLENKVDYEFRTTVVKELHTPEDIKALAKRIKGAKRYFLQNFVNSGDLIGKNLSAHSKETLEEMQKEAQKYIPETSLRGI